MRGGHDIPDQHRSFLRREPERVKEGQDDPLVEWFEDAYSYRDLERQAFIDLIVEKLEG